MLAILAVGIGILGMWLVMSLMKTEMAKITVLDWLGARAVAIRYPGWSLILWPLEGVHDILSTRIITTNLSEFRVVCRVNDDPTDTIKNDAYGLTELRSREVSLTYYIKFRQDISVEEQLRNFYDFIGTEDDKHDASTLEEKIRDIIESEFSKRFEKLYLQDAINVPVKMVEEVEEALRKKISDKHLPIEIESIVVNTKFEIVDEDLAEIFENRAKHALEMRAQLVTAEQEKRVAVIAAEKDREVAIIAIQTAEAQGKATLTEAHFLARAYGFSKLPRPEKAKAFLSLEALKAYREMAKNPSTKMIIGSNLLDEIKSMLGVFGGKP